MATDNDAIQAQHVVSNKNREYATAIANVDAALDVLNARLSTDGLVGGSDEDAGTDAAIVLAKVQTAAIAARVDVLFPIA